MHCLVPQLHRVRPGCQELCFSSSLQQVAIPVMGSRGRCETPRVRGHGLIGPCLVSCPLTPLFHHVRGSWPLSLLCRKLSGGAHWRLGCSRCGSGQMASLGFLGVRLCLSPRLTLSRSRVDSWLLCIHSSVLGPLQVGALHVLTC